MIRIESWINILEDEMQEVFQSTETGKINKNWKTYRIDLRD